MSGGGKTERRGVGVSDYCKVESHDCFGSSCTVIVFAAVGRISDCFWHALAVLCQSEFLRSEGSGRSSHARRPYQRNRDVNTSIAVCFARISLISYLSDPPSVCRPMIASQSPWSCDRWAHCSGAANAAKEFLTMLWPGAFRNPIWLRRDRQTVWHTRCLHHMTSADPNLWRDQRGLAALIHVTLTLLSASAFQWHINQPIRSINFCLFVGSSEWRGHCLSCLGVFTQSSCSLCVLRVLKVV